ncbi:unnamed protein product, partial [Rotaria magnacalcarata]
GRGGPTEEWATPPPAPTKCGPETGAISKGVGSTRGEQLKPTKILHTPKVVVPPGEFVTSTPGVNEPNASPSMPSLIVKTPDIMKEFNPDDDDAFESSEEEESFAGFMRFGPSAEMVLSRLETMLEDPASQDSNNFSLKRTLEKPAIESSIPVSLKRTLPNTVENDTTIIQPEVEVEPDPGKLIIPEEEAPSAPPPRRAGLRNLPDKGEGFYKV